MSRVSSTFKCFRWSPIEFHVSGTGEDYLDLSQTQLFLKVKVVMSDGSLLKDGEKVGPVNLFMHSLFSQVDVTLNERLISSSNNTYPYRAILEKLLNHSYDEKTSQLSAELFFKDTAGKMNVFDPSDPNPNEGFTKRADFIKKSETVDMIGRLHVDLFHQERLMLNLVDLKLKLIRSKPEFCLMGENSYKILIQHASLFVRKVRVNPAVTLAHAKSLEKTSAKYPINRVLCKIYSIPQVYMDGQPVPYHPLEPNFENNTFIRAYQSLFLSAEERGLYLSRSEYANGYSFFVYDLSPDLCSGEHLNLVRHSNLRLEVKFSKALEQTVSVIVYAEFENLIEINKARNILFDFGN
ncbi:hypothetical protein X975_23585, partial [Stegodyphus mimosarum]